MIFPDSDNVFTLQMLSTNTIVISLTPKIFNTNAATLIGMHVPGPLQRIYKEKKSETEALSGSSMHITIRRIFKHTG